MNDLVFAVYLPGRKTNVGGHVVLHKLVKILCDLGQEVWVTCEPMFGCDAKLINNIGAPNQKMWDMSFVKDKKLVAVYPETIKGNEFHADHIARWILYHTKGEIEKTWYDTDEYFFYVDGFTTQKDRGSKNLNVIDPKLDVFFNRGLGDKREGYCHINKKKYPKGEKMLEHLSSKDLTDFMKKGGFVYLAEELNKHEYFVTYDDATYHSIAAALCGCRSVILNPDPKITPDEYRKNYHMSVYGIAYGWNDLKHADMTRDMVKELMRKIERQSIKSVEEFVLFWKKKLQGYD